MVAIPSVSSLTPTLRDVTYCTVDSVQLKMDIYIQGGSDAPKPAVVYVHGGGWTGGDKSGGAGGQDFPELLSRGYIVVSLNYRLAPEYKFPAQIEDVKCAIRSLRAHAQQYHIDPTKIGAWGGSAGGHLVSLLGLANSSAGFDMGQYLSESSRVQAVVDYYGPSDLMASGLGNPQRDLVDQVFGSAYALKSASPVTYITPDDPPFLIVQGELDRIVPPSQSQELYDRLTAAGVPTTLIMVANAGHGFTPVGGSISPSRGEITKTMADFFDVHLKGQSVNARSTSTPIRASSLPAWPVALIPIVVAIIVAIVLIAGLKRSASRLRSISTLLHLDVECHNP